jgi:hypothetical protein
MTRGMELVVESITGHPLRITHNTPSNIIPFSNPTKPLNLNTLKFN